MTGAYLSRNTAFSSFVLIHSIDICTKMMMSTSFAPTTISSNVKYVSILFQNHILNNLYTDVSSYGIGVWTGALIYSEQNSFINCRRAWGWASSPNPNPLGNYLNVNNRLANSGFDSGIPSSVSWRPANYYSYGALNAANVESHVRSFAGPR